MYTYFNNTIILLLLLIYMHLIFYKKNIPTNILTDRAIYINVKYFTYIQCNYHICI